MTGAQCQVALTDALDTGGQIRGTLTGLQEQVRMLTATDKKADK